MNVFGTKVEGVPAAADAHAWCSAFLGAGVRLVHMDDPATRRPVDPAYALPGETVSFADGYPLLVTTLASLDALNSLIAEGPHAHEGPLPMNRFRPNVVVAGTEPWAEDHWTRIAIGEVVFRAPKPSGRCVVTTTDQATAVRGREPLHTLARHRRRDGRLLFGQNLVPLSPARSASATRCAYWRRPRRTSGGKQSGDDPAGPGTGSGVPDVQQHEKLMRGRVRQAPRRT